MRQIILISLLLFSFNGWAVENVKISYEGVVGPLTIIKDGIATLPVPLENREMSLRIVYPDQVGPFPIIVFSHGTFSSSEKYNLVVEFWAEHGYVVILPNHLDANYGIVPNKTEDMIRIIDTRISDMSFVVDNLDNIERQNPGLKGKLNQEMIIAAGGDSFLAAGPLRRRIGIGRVIVLVEQQPVNIVKIKISSSIQCFVILCLIFFCNFINLLPCFSA